MRNVVLWKQVFLGASLFLCGTSPVMATEVGDLVPDVRGNALQQDGRRVTCTISDKADQLLELSPYKGQHIWKYFRYGRTGHT